MKVILLKDVAKLGRKGSVCEVPSGHALNMLIPRKLAVPATAENMKQHSAETARHAADDARSAEAFRSVVASLSQTVVAYHAPANDQGILFKGIRASDIAARLREMGYQVSDTAIDLPHPLKETGTHTVRLHQGSLEGVCTLSVIKQ